ncbi:hypothetical protein BX666DRAFT_1905991 [Dichotomocladium elegans]|nr:hypothetical protein BX666DRAFT_1905991 [Dichotomocladium elegans]
MWDGYPASRLIGIDKSSLYIDCGYDLFNDRTKCKIRFVAGDLFDTEFLSTFAKQAGIVHAGSVIHLFPSRDMMRTFVRGVATLLTPGGWFAGTHVASNKTGHVYLPERRQTKYFISIADFRAVLEDVGFGCIEFQLEPRTSEFEEQMAADFHRYWLSFTAVYQPTSF